MQPSDEDQHDRFLRLFLPQEDSLWGYLRSLLLPTDEIADVMQNVAAVLWRKFDPAMSTEEFRRWSFGVARLEALSFRRDRARDREGLFGDDLLHLLEATAMEDENDRTPHLLRALESCLSALPERQRALVESAYAPGSRIDELARAAGRTAMALYKQLHRIRLLLAECVEKRLVSVEESA